MVIDYGGLKEIVYMGGGSKHGFAFGFPVLKKAAAVEVVSSFESL